MCDSAAMLHFLVTIAMSASCHKPLLHSQIDSRVLHPVLVVMFCTSPTRQQAESSK